MTNQQTADEEQVFLTDEQLAEPNKTTEQTSGQENQEQPPTPKEAWDHAVAQMTQEQAIEWRQRSAYAISAGHPVPPPPGYQEPTPAPVDAAKQAEQDAATAKDLETQIAEAQKAGEWDKSLALKHQLTNLVRKQSQPKAATWGWRGPTS